MRNTFAMLIAGIIIFSVFTIFLLVEICNASASTLHVGSGQTYSTIQAAINDANESDIIYVHSGTYTETIIIDKTITLTGEGKGITFIQGNNDNTIKIASNDVSISGFSIRNVGGIYSSILLDSVINCEISNNIIENAGIGIYFTNSGSNIIHDNNIQNNNVNGIFLTPSSSDNTIYKNYFSNNNNANAKDYNSNIWSYNNQGNYWDDYDDYGTDGIGDTPYVIDSNSQDSYPLGVFLNQDPVASITSISPNPAIQGQIVNFDGHGVDDGTIVEWEWRSSKDGDLSSSEDFSSSSLSVGTHTIKFRVKDDDEKWSEYAERTLTINPPGSQENQKPTATIIKPNPNIKTTYIYGESVEFQGEGQDTDGIINGWSWRSEPAGITSSNEIFTKNNIPIGEYQIFLKVKDNDNEWSLEKYATIEIIEDTSIENNPPTADPGGPYSGYTNTTIFFDASGSFDSDSGDSISYYQWDFGDETTGTDVSHDHTYSIAQSYVVTLTVTDSHGSTNSKTTYANISININNNNNGNDSIDDGDTGGKKDTGIPGFEIFFVLLALIAVILFRKKQK